MLVVSLAGARGCGGGEVGERGLLKSGEGEGEGEEGRKDCWALSVLAA